MKEIKIEHCPPPGDDKRLYQILNKLDKKMVPSLSSRVDILLYSKKLAAYAELFYVHMEGQDLGNCAVYLNSGMTGFITSIGILPDAQRQGMGKALIREVIKKAAQYKIYQIELEVYTKNTKGIKFYHSIGFEIQRELNDWLHMVYKMKPEERGAVC